MQTYEAWQLIYQKIWNKRKEGKTHQPCASTTRRVAVVLQASARRFGPGLYFVPSNHCFVQAKTVLIESCWGTHPHLTPH